MTNFKKSDQLMINGELWGKQEVPDGLLSRGTRLGKSFTTYPGPSIALKELKNELIEGLTK